MGDRSAPGSGQAMTGKDTSQRIDQGLGRTDNSAWARRETKPLGRPSQYGVTGDQPNSLSSSSASRAQPTMSNNARAPRGGQVRPLIPPVSASWSSPRARPCDSRLDAGWVSPPPPQGAARGETGQKQSMLSGRIVIVPNRSEGRPDRVETPDRSLREDEAESSNRPSQLQRPGTGRREPVPGFSCAPLPAR